MAATGDSSRTRGSSRGTAALVRRALGLLGALTVFGTVGFAVLERWGLLESLYMTVITLSTVGFGEVRPLSPAGRTFTVVLIMIGVAVFAYLYTAVSHIIIDGGLRGTVRRRRMQKAIDALRDHYIICGYGRVGAQVVDDLIEQKARCVIVERNEELLEHVRDRLVVVADATDDAELYRAGIDRARGLVAATGDDATNVFISLTARSLNADLVIVGRANDPATEPKLLRAGATQVISPYTISGKRIASQLLHPSVTAFLDIVMYSPDLELYLQEVIVHAGSDLDGARFADAAIRTRTGVNVLAVKRGPGGRLLTGPPAEMSVSASDILIGLGTVEQLDGLRGLAAGGLRSA